MNGFCSDLIIMVPKLNYFIFMQIDYPRWLPGTVTKNSRNKKMIISQDPLVEIDPALCKVGKKAGNTHISQDGGKYW